MNQLMVGSVKHSPIGSISVSAIHRDIRSLRPANRAMVSGPLGHRASHGLGTIGEGDAAVHQALAVLASTAARTFALGVALNNSCLKVTVISMATETEKPANRSDEPLYGDSLARVDRDCGERPPFWRWQTR